MATHQFVKILCVTLIIHLHLQSATGSATKDDFVRLYNTLTANNSGTVRPVQNQSSPVLLDMEFNLFSMLEVKDIECQVDIISILIVKWKDEFFTWNPADYGDISRIHLKDDVIWSPKLVIGPSRVNWNYVWDTPTTKIVESNGEVYFSNVAYRSPFCDLNMRYFPYDYQLCVFYVTVMDGYSSDVDIQSHSASKSFNFAPNREWIVVRITSRIKYQGYGNYITFLELSLLLQRRPTFCNLNVIAPAIIMCILCMITPFVSLESGERLSYALTTLLALSVYITYIGGLIPRSSDPIPILFQYIVSLFVVSSICVILSLAVIRVRWCIVKRSPNNEKYIRILGFKVLLGRKLWANKVVVSPWFKSKEEDQCKEKIKGSSVQTNISDYYKIKLDKVSNGDLEDSVVIVRATDGDLRKCPDLVRTESLTGSDESNNADENQIDPALNNLCQFMDTISFILVFIPFLAMTFYTFIGFYSQEEPTQP